MKDNVVDSPVPLNGSLREQKRRLENGRAMWKPGIKVPNVRGWVQESWEDMARRRIRERRTVTDPISSEELESRRRGPMIARVIKLVENELKDNVEGMFAVADTDCRLLAVAGAQAARALAASSGLDIGFPWSSAIAGFNGIGSVAQRPVATQILADEHWCHDQRQLICTTVPIVLAGEFVAMVNITEHWLAARRSTLFLLTEFGRQIGDRLAADDGVRAALRSRAARLVERCSEAALVINGQGEVLAARDVALTRVDLPKQLTAGERSLARLGRCLLEPVPEIDGWLVRLVRDGERPVLRVILDFSDPNRRWVRVRGAGEWDRMIPQDRFVDVLTVLHGARSGLSASDLAARLPHGKPGSQANARTLLWRLRNAVGPLFDSEPYRFGDGIVVELREPSANT